jgi:DNA repair ATPase RecN
VVARRERAAVRKEAELIERELGMEERSRVALERTNHAKAALKLIEEQHAALAKWEAAVVKGEANLTVHQEELATRTQGLQEQEASLQEREAKVEEFLAERSASIDRVVRWADEVNPCLDALRLSPIQVAGAPPSLGAILQVLDSAAERLRHLESAILDRLETEGRAVARGMAEYILTCFRSHDPAFLLTPVLVGLVQGTVIAAQEGVQEAADMVASRVQRRPGPARRRDSSGPPEQ